MIYRIQDSGVVERCQNFAAIGSGLYLAESALFQRSQHAGHGLGTTIYNVYEAMRIGSSAPGVGASFHIGIVQWEYWREKPTNEGNVEWSYLQPPYYQYLDKIFERYGPKPLDTELKDRPRLVERRQRAIVLTPKGEHSEKIQADIRRSQAARKREAKKRAAKQSLSQKSEPEL